MKTNIEKIESVESLSKLLMLQQITDKQNEIVKQEKKQFDTALQLAKFVKKANDYFISTECKEEFKKLNVNYKNFREYISDLIGKDVRQAQRYIQISKASNEILNEFTQVDKDNKNIHAQNIKNCCKFLSDTKKGKVNLSATKPIIDKSKAIKPKKLATKNKSIEILLHEITDNKLRQADIKEVIKLLKDMLPKKEKVTKQVSKAVSIVA